MTEIAPAVQGACSLKFIEESMAGTCSSKKALLFPHCPGAKCSQPFGKHVRQLNEWGILVVIFTSKHMYLKEPFL
jgi:hypothetical protein